MNRCESEQLAKAGLDRLESEGKNSSPTSAKPSIEQDRDRLVTVIKNFQNSWHELEVAHDCLDRCKISAATKKYAEARIAIMTMKV